MKLKSDTIHSMILQSKDQFANLLFHILQRNPKVNMRLSPTLYNGDYDEKTYPFVNEYITIVLFTLAQNYLHLKCPLYKSNFKIYKSVYENTEQSLSGMYTLKNMQLPAGFDIACVISVQPLKQNKLSYQHVTKPETLYDHFNLLFWKKRIPHICCSYGTHVCRNRLRIKKNAFQNARLLKQLNSWKKMKNEKLISQSFAYTFVEAPSLTLHKYLQQNSFDIIEWKSLLFQLFFTMALIQKEIPHFVHNDLTPKRIHLKKVPKGGQFVYTINNIKYYVPNIGYIIKVLPSVYSYSKTVYDNTIVHEGWIQASLGIHPDNSQFYDIHSFCNHLYFTKNTPEYVKGKIEGWIPDKTLLMKVNTMKLVKGRLRNCKQSVHHNHSFQELLKSKMFNAFHKLDKKRIVFQSRYKL